MILPITFLQINVSCQVGDIAYASLHQGRQSGRNHPGPTVNTKPFIFGLITAVNRVTNTITVDTNAANGIGSNFANFPFSWPGDLGNLYVFFQKSQLANTSGVTGYFLETEYRNYSTLPAEMFATAVDYVESSK